MAEVERQVLRVALSEQMDRAVRDCNNVIVQRVYAHHSLADYGCCGGCDDENGGWLEDGTYWPCGDARIIAEELGILVPERLRAFDVS